MAACLDAPVVIEPGAIELIPTGFAMALPAGYEAQVRPRSGLAIRHGVTVANAPGTIDADYRGQVMVGLVRRVVTKISRCPHASRRQCRQGRQHRLLGGNCPALQADSSTGGRDET